MTVTGLWSLLKKHKLIRNVIGADARELLEGKRVAIDVSMWIVQGTVIEQTGNTRKQHFLLTSFWRLCRYIRAGSFPVGVLEGACPSSKRRRRLDDSEFQQNMILVANMFHLMGCPVIQADGEAEGCCAQLSKNNLVEAIESSDSDVFPFGATGYILKTVSSNGTWEIEYVLVDEVWQSLGFCQHGLISLALLSG